MSVLFDFYSCFSDLVFLRLVNFAAFESTRGNYPIVRSKTIEFFTIGKSDRSDRNKMQFPRIITILNLNVIVIQYFQYLLDCGHIVK